MSVLFLFSSHSPTLLLLHPFKCCLYFFNFLFYSVLSLTFLLQFNSSVVVSFLFFIVPNEIFSPCNFVLHYHPDLLLPVMNTRSFAYPISTCIFLPILSFYALKEITVKRHKINNLIGIKYLYYHNSSYLIRPFVTSVMANSCINTHLK